MAGKTFSWEEGVCSLRTNVDEVNVMLVQLVCCDKC
jgi:hypothetical protein